MARKKLTAAEPGTSIQIAEQTPPDIAAGEIALRAAQAPGALELALGIPALASADELLDIGVQALNSAALHMARAGMAFRRVREQTPHGNSGELSGRADSTSGDLSGRPDKSFQAYLDERGISRQRAYEAMAYATFLESLPEAQSLRLLAVPHSKVMLLTKAEPEVIESLLEDGALDGDQPLNVSDLKKALREARADIEVKEERATKREREIEVLQREVSRLKRERAKATPDADATKARDAATAAAMQVRADIAAQGEGVSSLNMAIIELRELAEAAGNAEEHDQFLGGLIADAMVELRRIRDLHELPVIGDQGAADWLAGA